MMKRKLFFWIDRLQISRSERIAVSVLMMIMLVLTSALLLIDFSPHVEEDAYTELEKVFRERSRIKQQEHDAIMARYIPFEETSTQVRTDDSQLDSDLQEIENENVGDNESLSPIFEEPEPEGAFRDTNKVNINTASAEELQKLPGIGPAYSTRIIEWRKEHGEFKTVEQLLEIRGIGPVRLEKIRPLIVL